jgi:hypothetical protein
MSFCYTPGDEFQSVFRWLWIGFMCEGSDSTSSALYRLKKYTKFSEVNKTVISDQRVNRFEDHKRRTFGQFLGDNPMEPNFPIQVEQTSSLVKTRHCGLP